MSYVLIQATVRDENFFFFFSFPFLPPLEWSIAQGPNIFWSDIQLQCDFTARDIKRYGG